MQWAYSGAPDSASATCAAVTAIMHSRPTPSATFLDANLAFFAAMCATVVVVTGASLALRDRFPRLRERSRFSTLLLTVGVLCFLFGGPSFRNSPAVLDALGYPAMPCGLVAALYLFGYSLLTFAFFMRAFVAVAKVRRAQLVSKLKPSVQAAAATTASGGVPPARRGSASTVTSGVGAGAPEDSSSDETVSGTSSGRPFGVRAVRGVMSRVFSLMVRDEAARAAMERGGGAAQLATMHRLLRDSAEATEFRALVTVALVSVTPFFVCAVVLLSVVPPYRYSCTGCELYLSCSWPSPLSSPSTRSPRCAPFRSCGATCRTTRSVSRRSSSERYSS